MTPAAVLALVASLTGQPAARVQAVADAVDLALASPAGAEVEALTQGHGRALMLVLAVRESELRADVEACRVTGDRGHAYGLWQEHDARVCSLGLAGQARRAVAHMAACSRTEAGTLEAALSCYGGSRAEVARRVAMFGRMR